MRMLKSRNMIFKDYLLNCGTLSIDNKGITKDLLPMVKDCTCSLCGTHVHGLTEDIIDTNTKKVSKCSILGCTKQGYEYTLPFDIFTSPIGLLRLGEEFLEEMNFDVFDLTFKAEVLELLYLVFNQYVSLDRDDIIDIVFTEEVLSEYHIFKLVDIAGYWSNDLMDVVVDTLASVDIVTGLSNLTPDNAWLKIHNWVKEKTSLEARF